MVKAELSKQLMVYIDNTVGKLAEVTSVISSSDINQLAICAYEVEGMVAIMFVTEDNNQAKRLLEKQGFDVQEEEVVLLTVDNKPGALQVVTNKIAESGVDLSLIYGSASKDAATSQIVLISKNNLDVMMIIKTLLERR